MKLKQFESCCVLYVLLLDKCEKQPQINCIHRTETREINEKRMQLKYRLSEQYSPDGIQLCIPVTELIENSCYFESIFN